ncbi:DUF6603 domain-containing protein [Amycolatopsis balhimycina]|nr:DUF6603 domain-containing protein [Amycolatopsis balhimycina]
MAAKAGTLELLAREIASALRPLEQHLAESTREEFLERLGLRLPGGLGAAGGAIGAVVVQAGGLAPLIGRLVDAVGGGDVKQVADAGVALLGAIRTTLDAITALGPALDAAVAAAGSLTDAQRARLRAEVAQLPKRLVDFVLLGYLEGKGPGVVDFLTLTGIVQSEPVLLDSADPTVVPVRRKAIRFDRLIAALTDPPGWLRDIFDFGNATFDGSKLFSAIGAYFAGRDIPYVQLAPPGGAPVLDAYVLRLAADRASLPPSITARLRLPLAGDLVEKIPLTPLWTVVVEVHGRYDEGLTARIVPPFGFELLPATGELHVDASVGLEAKGTEPIVLIGRTGSSRLEFTRFAVALGLEADGTTAGAVSAEPSARMVLEGGHVLVDLSEGDGFLRTITGGGRFEAGFDVQARWTPSGGLQLGGSGGVDLALPIHVDLGPVEITTLYLSAGVADGGVPIEISGGFTASLGPISATVDRVGVVAVTRFPAGGGNLGPLDLGFRFKAPSGIGLVVDAGVVTGGGFLSYDEKTREYAGALELRFAGFLELKAIGLISTRMPDGSDGFSLLAVITTEFPGGLQLGLGFTLLGVGGVLGLHRRMNLDALVEGVHSGAIESVMFPRDVVANAPRILSDLRAFFPPEQGTFLVGPMAKIGWGTPALVTVSLAVIVEIPGDIAILGVLRCVLPEEHLPLLVLQVNFVGAIEFGKQRLWFYAELFDSHILSVTISGGMGLLIGWGDDADLVLSVGGFHPSFSPPQLPFPVPQRICVDILNQPGERISVSGYFAVTSNTVQFGAAAELVLGFDDFGINGHLSFDALFQFSPFAFVIEISAGVTLKAFGVGLFGIDLRFQLSGPAPWRARGSGSISLLFFEISADFDISWGSKDNPTLPPIAVLPLLAGELGKQEGWQTRLPTGGTNPLVTLRPLDDTDQLVLHPLGTLFIRQRAIPLNVTVDKVGAQRPADGKRFTVTPAGGLRRVSTTSDKFAMAQFQNMDDAAKLSRPAFENQDAGLELAAADQRLLSTRAARRSARYEMIVTDSKVRKAHQAGAAVAEAEVAAAAAPTKRLYRPSSGVFTKLLDGSSTARSPLSRQEAAQRQPFPAEQTVRLPGQRFVIAQQRNNSQAFAPTTGGPVPSGTEAVFGSRTAAEDALAGWVRADARLAGTLHVLPGTEAAGTPARHGTWSSAGPLPAATAFGPGTEVLLRTGKVLVAGGRDGTGQAIAATAVFDPVPGTWTAAGQLGHARDGHTVSLLPDGTVLAVGGRAAAAPDGLASAERYDPVAAAWTPAAHQPATARYGHTATVLASGDVLVTGGIGAHGRSLSTVELYRARTGAWEPDRKPMTDRRHGHRAVLVDGGRVLVAGGAVATGEDEVPTALCELYDPETGSWTPTGSMTTPRAGHQVTPLPGGAVLVTGGDGPVTTAGGRVRLSAVDSAERYDPHTGQWTTVARMPAGRTRHRALPLPDGQVAVIGGAATVPAAGYRSVVTYDPRTGAWAGVGALATGRWDFAAVALADGRVLVAGGHARAGASAASGTATATNQTEILTP